MRHTAVGTRAPPATTTSTRYKDYRSDYSTRAPATTNATLTPAPTRDSPHRSGTGATRVSPGHVLVSSPTGVDSWKFENPTARLRERRLPVRSLAPTSPHTHQNHQYRADGICDTLPGAWAAYPRGVELIAASPPMSGGSSPATKFRWVSAAGSGGISSGAR